MKYLKKYKLFESVVKTDEFPVDEDIRDIFFDITDELYHHNFEVEQGGYVFFPTADLTRDLRSQMLYDMSYEDDWLNKEIPGFVDEYWKDYFLTVEESNKVRYSNVEYLWLSDLEDKSDFWRLFYENILNGNIKAYPIKFVHITVDKNSLEPLFTCLERIYETTGFRPIGDLTGEDYVDEDNGDIVTLFHAELKLCKVSDIEYEMLSKSILTKGLKESGGYSSNLNPTLIKKFK